jgi:uncharacterized protein (DUF58 family)
MTAAAAAASATAASAATARQRAELLAASFPPLMVAAERVASTVAQGVHGRRRVGSGYAFWQFRQYQPGDPSTRIDWRQSAKTQRLFIRETEWEAAQSVWLWCDSSASMDYRSTAALPTKHERATVLMLALASLLVRGGEHIALLGRDRVPYTGQNAMLRLAETLVRIGRADLSVPQPVRIPRHARVVLFGDFLAPLAEVDALVRAYGADDVDGHMVQVLDPIEEEFPFAGRTEFRGFEDEGRVLLDRAQTVRADYLGRLREHRQGLADIARAAGWSFLQHRTDRSPQTALLALYQGMSDDWS